MPGIIPVPGVLSEIVTMVNGDFFYNVIERMIRVRYLPNGFCSESEVLPNEISLTQKRLEDCRD